MSRREFGRLDGCSDTLVRRGLKQGSLKAFPDGSLDPKLAGTAWRQRPDGVRTESANTANSSHSGVRTSDDTSETYSDALRRKEIALASLREQELATKGSKLVDRAAARKLFFDTARESRDAWLAWPARVAVTMAAELGIDARTLLTSLHAAVHQHLTEMGIPEGHL